VTPMNQSENVTAPPNSGDRTSKKVSTPRRVAVNTASNWVAIVVRIIINVFLFSYVYRRLGGKEVFGVYRLGVALSMGVTYLSFGMAGSVIRLASESIAGRQWDRLSQTMSVARTFLLAAAAVGVLLIVLASLFLLGPLNVPEDLRPAAATMLQLTALGGGIHLMYILYAGLLQAKQRYDLANIGQVGEVVLRGGLVVLCFELGWVGLETLGASAVVAALCGLVALVIMTRRMLPEARLSFRNMSRVAAREVFGFGAWVTVNQASRQGLAQAGVPLVSATLGPAAAAVFSVPQMISAYLSSVVGGLTATLRPVATGFAVRGDQGRLARLYYVGARLSLMMVAPALAMLLTHGKPFLAHWLGAGMVEAYTVMLVYVGLVFGQLIGTSAEHFILAVGRIRGVALSRLVTSLLGIGMAVAVAVWTDWGILGVVVGLMLPVTLRGIIYLPVRVRADAQVTWTGLMARCVLPPVLTAGVPVAAGWLLLILWPPGSLWEVLFQMAVVALVYIPVAWFLVLKADDRELILRMFQRGETTGESPTGETL